jgi:hypothetical protein
VKRKTAKNTAKRKRSSSATKKTTKEKLYEAAVTRSREHTTATVSAPMDNSGVRNSISTITTATTTTAAATDSVTAADAATESAANLAARDQ